MKTHYVQGENEQSVRMCQNSLGKGWLTHTKNSDWFLSRRIALFWNVDCTCSSKSNTFLFLLLHSIDGSCRCSHRNARCPTAQLHTSNHDRPGVAFGSVILEFVFWFLVSLECFWHEARCNVPRRAIHSQLSRDAQEEELNCSRWLFLLLFFYFFFFFLFLFRYAPSLPPTMQQYRGCDARIKRTKK